MIARDDLPPTPDWQPEPHAHLDVSRHADPPAHEAQPLTWTGDDS